MVNNMLKKSMLKKAEACAKPKFFRLFFLKNDESHNVEVEEVEEIDFTKIIERLERGESIFISPSQKQNCNKKLLFNESSKENAAKPWYFTRM